MILLQVLALQLLMGVLVENNLHLGVFLFSNINYVGLYLLIPYLELGRYCSN